MANVTNSATNSTKASKAAARKAKAAATAQANAAAKASAATAALLSAPVTGLQAITAPPTGTGTQRVTKVQANRPSAHGITAPSAGGMCHAVWQQCQTLYTNGTMPTVSLLKAWALATGHNVSNAQQERCRWAKFNGHNPRALNAQGVAAAVAAAGIGAPATK